MFTISTEAIQASRDQLRLINAKALSKSIQFYYNINGDYPESGLGINVAELLYNDELLTKSPRDPAYTSATVPLNYYLYKLTNSYNDIYVAIKDFDSKKHIAQLKSKLYKYIGIDKKNENQRKQGIDSWGDSSNVSNNTIIEYHGGDPKELKCKISNKNINIFEENGSSIELIYYVIKDTLVIENYDANKFIKKLYVKENLKF